MKETKKYYVDEEGNMLGYPRYHSVKFEKPAASFHAKLKIIGVGWLNSGFCLELQDENGKTYNMNDVMFREYLNQKDIHLEGDWKFYSQGIAFSIGV